jgi:hypothetical protein
LIAGPVGVFLFLHFIRKEPLEKNLETTFLIALGGGTLFVDIVIDVWFYATIPGGLRGNQILHLLMVGAFAAYALWKKVGLKWVTPAFLEVAFLFAMVRFTGDSYVPHLTAFMGLLATWLAFIFVSGYKRIPAKTKLGKIISEFI